ncbi:hypothetical protein [Peribacillus frigoritolerans]|uniref:hypothetical protein n=1 Tax=Peribacillus frigoritolerans TaxID=450367 RepID=UPI00207A057F|nr:hypothetical protein [Peribacillus frigoritolerans]USK66404.1 hypothetical protein LIT26_07200 [Peribacillus frigoritolerans]
MKAALCRFSQTMNIRSMYHLYETHPSLCWRCDTPSKKDINQAWICWAFMEKTKTFEDEKNWIDFK